MNTVSLPFKNTANSSHLIITVPNAIMSAPALTVTTRFLFTLVWASLPTDVFSTGNEAISYYKVEKLITGSTFTELTTSSPSMIMDTTLTANIPSTPLAIASNTSY